MRLTKRQLKRIIREEYSRLKRRGLIKESGLVAVGNSATFQCEIKELAGQGDDVQQIRTDYSVELEDMCYDALEECLAQSGGTVVTNDGTTYEGLTADDFQLLPSMIYSMGRGRIACRWRLMNLDTLYSS